MTRKNKQKMDEELYTPAPGSAGKRLLLTVAKTFGYLLLSVLVSLPILWALGPALDTEALQALQSGDLSQVSPGVLAAIWFALLSGAIVAAIFFRRVVDKEPVASVGWQAEGAIAEWGRGALLGAGLITAAFLILWGAGWLTVAGVRFELSVLFTWAVFFLVQATYEEIVFRGYLFRMTAEYFDPRVALVVTSLLFGVVHGFNEHFSWIAFLNILLAGFVLGALVLRTGRLWAAAGLHFTWNLFQSVVYGFPVSGIKTYRLLTTETDGPPLFTGGGFGLEGSLVTILLLGGCLWWFRHRA